MSYFHSLQWASVTLQQTLACAIVVIISNLQDILNSRRMTTDIQKIEFDVPVPKKFGGGLQTFWMFDVGGQKGERKKWIQVRQYFFNFSPCDSPFDPPPSPWRSDNLCDKRSPYRD